LFGVGGNREGLKSSDFTGWFDRRGQSGEVVRFEFGGILNVKGMGSK